MPVCIMEMVGQPGFNNSRVGGEQVSKLIRNSGKGPPHSTRREFIQMHRDDSPGALHHELHGKPADNEQGKSRRKNPEGDEDYSEDGSQNNRATASPFLRQMANYCSAADRADGVNDPSRGLLRHAIVALFTEKSLIHVLGPMRHGVECR